jgi:hypothetical protein
MTRTFMTRTDDENDTTLKQRFRLSTRDIIAYRVISNILDYMLVQFFILKLT